MSLEIIPLRRINSVMVAELERLVCGEDDPPRISRFTEGRLTEVLVNRNLLVLLAKREDRTVGLLHASLVSTLTGSRAYLSDIYTDDPNGEDLDVIVAMIERASVEMGRRGAECVELRVLRSMRGIEEQLVDLGFTLNQPTDVYLRCP